MPALGLVLMAGAGCARGADADAREGRPADAAEPRRQARTCSVSSRFAREGSAPLPAGESGAPRVVVYFNATLELAQDYSFGSLG